MADNEGEDRGREYVPPDGGWGWVVCFASFWINATVFGLNNCFGVLLVAMLDDPQLQKSGAKVFNTAWIGSLTMFMTFFGTYISSILTDRFGWRRTAFVGAVITFIGCLTSSFATRLEILYLTYGILIGVGFSVTYTPSLTIIPHYFDRKIGKAAGLASCGSGVSTVLLPPFLRFLIDSIGLWHTLHFIAGLGFLLIPCALTFKSNCPRRRFHNNQNEDDGSDAVHDVGCCRSWLNRHVNFRIWRNRNYRIWCAGILVGFLGYFVPFAHLIKYVEEVCPDPSTNGPILISCIGLSSIVGGIAPGYISDKPAVKRVMTRIEFQQLSFIVIGLFNLLVPTLVMSFPAMVVATLIMGIFDGCFVCMLVPVARDIVGPDDAGQGIGFIFFTIAFPMLVGGPTAGLIYDITGSYNLAFILAGIPPILGALIMCFVKLKPVKDEGGEEGNAENIPIRDVTDNDGDENVNRLPLRFIDQPGRDGELVDNPRHRRETTVEGRAPISSTSEVDEDM
ncbi:monocarboxylate transporter 10-like [Ptychodera flava]|uniref:monocarboxylate transporter 10-like n=1 Tax=Ptychodera flava TaxID=63121 RepID=UPI00396A9773